MESANNGAYRPIQVTIGVILWAVGAILNFIELASQMNWHDWVMYPTFVIMVALSLLLLWFNYQGRNWARWLLLLIVSFRFLLLTGAIQRMAEPSALEVTSLVARILAQVGATVLFFSRPASIWFLRDRGTA
jgi:hypothetical protein